jgi:hypothetical protein
MAIDVNNPLLNGPKRVDAAPTPAKDYKALYERALQREQALEAQVRRLQDQLDGKVPTGFGRGAKPGLSGGSPPAARAGAIAPKWRLTAADIERGKSPKGGWTREILAAWGVSWPPPKGWKDELLKANR